MAAVPPFDPTTLSLTGYWRASFGGAPWAATASSGASGTNGTLAVGDAPSVGTAVNGLTPADFVGGNYLVTANNSGTYVNDSAWSAWVLFYADTVDADVGPPIRYFNAQFFLEAGSAYEGMGYSRAGVQASTQQASGGTQKDVLIACSTGAWHLAQAKHDGVDLKLRVDSGAWSSIACGPGSASAGSPLRVGSGLAGLHNLDGKILELAISDTVLADADFDSVLSYVNTTYALTLGQAASFDPATLPLTGWWRASYAASPWLTNASTSTSLANGSLTEGTNPPSTGTALNSWVPADFDGTNDHIAPGGNAGTFFDASTFSGWILFNADAVDTNFSAFYENDCLLSTQPSAYFAIGMKSTGDIGIRFVAGAEAIVSTTFTIGQWGLVQWKYDGANIKIRMNGGAWQSTACTGGFGDLTNTLQVGTNYGGAAFLDGRIADIGLADTTLSDADFDSVLAYINARYALALA